MKSTHLGMGVVLFEQALDIDQEFLFEYIDWLKANKENEFIYEEENGVLYAINKSGFKFNVEDIKRAPQRFIDLLNRQYQANPPKKYIDFISSLENTVYKCIVGYCKYFEDAATTSWWRPIGHIVGYESGQKIGPHCDTQVPYEWGKKINNQAPIHNTLSINLYLNDCVDSDSLLNKYTYTGGEIHFSNIPYTYMPKAGSVLVYPSSYIGRHEVCEIKNGERYAFLSNACYGASFDSQDIEIIGQDTGNKHWMPELISDLSKITDHGNDIKE